MEFLITIVAVILLVGAVSSCPSVCSCTANANGLRVDCSGIGLDSIPTDLPSNTYYFYLNGNQITSIQSGTFNDLPSLTHLYVNSNQITSIQSGTFNNLTSLTRLYLYDNQITSIQSGAFIDLTSLTYLDLDSNQITSIQEGAFNNLRSLTILYLYHNQITSIQSGAFNDLTSLTYLYLHDNNITSIQEGAFNTLTSLTSLFMNKNNISFVSLQTFQNLSQLFTLEFTMFCGCTFNIPFWRGLNVRKQFPHSISCYDYTGLYLEDLETKDFYKCNEALSTPSTTKSRTTSTPTSRKTVSSASKTTTTPASRTTTTPTSRTTVIPANRTTVSSASRATTTPMSRTTITTTSAARLTRKKLEATAFAPRTVIGTAIGAGSLAGGILLFCVICRVWRRSKDKYVKFEQQQDKNNSVIPAITPTTFPQRPTKNPPYII